MSKNTCQVCSLKPARYRCPACETTSCSLDCSQSHKIYCAPKHLSSLPTGPSQELNSTQQPADVTNGHILREESREEQRIPFPEALGSSRELQELFSSYPRLRSQLREIYQVTLPDAWIESQVQHVPRRPFQKWKGTRRINRGPWTPEKGLRRGVGKVRKAREQYEGGLGSGRDAEGFMRFVALVNGENGENRR